MVEKVIDGYIDVYTKTGRNRKIMSVYTRSCVYINYMFVDKLEEITPPSFKW